MEYTEIFHMLNFLGQDPSQGLPEDIFLLVSKLTPLINVDLLIQDDQKRTLLNWRDDGYYKPGWHIPGGIIRYKETIAERLRAVGKNELEAEIDFDPGPLAVHELLIPERKERGHFISLLYRCYFGTPLNENQRFQAARPKANQWMWHATYPEKMISPHEIYRNFFDHFFCLYDWTRI